jgi:hypothetical protein
VIRSIARSLSGAMRCSKDVQLQSQRSTLRATRRNATTAATQKITMITLQPAFCLCVLLLAKTAHRVGHGNVQLSSAVDDSLKQRGKILRAGRGARKNKTRAGSMFLHGSSYNCIFLSSNVCIKSRLEKSIDRKSI